MFGFSPLHPFWMRLSRPTRFSFCRTRSKCIFSDALTNVYFYQPFIFCSNVFDCLHKTFSARWFFVFYRGRCSNTFKIEFKILLYFDCNPSTRRFGVNLFFGWQMDGGSCYFRKSMAVPSMDGNKDKCKLIAWISRNHFNYRTKHFRIFSTCPSIQH